MSPEESPPLTRTADFGSRPPACFHTVLPRKLGLPVFRDGVADSLRGGVSVRAREVWWERMLLHRSEVAFSRMVAAASVYVRVRVCRLLSRGGRPNCLTRVRGTFFSEELSPHRSLVLHRTGDAGGEHRPRTRRNACDHVIYIGDHTRIAGRHIDGNSVSANISRPTT